MGRERDVCLAYDDVDDSNPVFATRILLPQDSDPSTIDVDEIPRERFVGRGVVVRTLGVEARDVITYESIADQIEHVQPGDIVLVDTGWGRLHPGNERADSDYELNQPTLEPGIVAALIVRGVLAIGIDAPRLDSPLVNPGPCAHMFAAASGIVCTNLTNLEDLDTIEPMITVTPRPDFTRDNPRVDVTAVALG